MGPRPQAEIQHRTADRSRAAGCFARVYLAPLRMHAVTLARHSGQSNVISATSAAASQSWQRPIHMAAESLVAADLWYGSGTSPRWAVSEGAGLRSSRRVRLERRETGTKRICCPQRSDGPCARTSVTFG